MQDTKNFKGIEFQCPCCGQEFMQDSFIARLQEARTMAGIWFWINSGWRCEKHNRTVSGTYKSAHLRGCAADIRIVDTKSLFAVVKSLLGAGFVRLRVGRTFVHADTDSTKPQNVMWTY